MLFKMTRDGEIIQFTKPEVAVLTKASQLLVPLAKIDENSAGKSPQEVLERIVDGVYTPFPAPPETK